jgi:hypothetical protein
MQCDKPRAKGWGKANQMCNAMEITSKANKKKVSLGEQTTMHLHLAPHKISNTPETNQKANQRWCQKKNGHACNISKILS